MATLPEKLGAELEQIDREYAAEFAGQSRFTRSLDTLDALIRRVDRVMKEVDQIPSAAQGPQLLKLREAAAQSVDLYRRERGAIERAQAVGPSFEQFSNEATSANLCFARYARHYAGKDRSTRDAPLLGEIVEDLRQIDKRMTAVLAEHKSADFERDRTVVRENLSQYQKEVELIEKAQRGTNDEEHASYLATIANNQFAVYQAHFAGEPRISRRPGLLLRLITTLKKTRDEMVALKNKGFSIDFNNKNITVVEDRLGTYESELAEIRKLRQATAMTDIMGELGGAANKLFDEYREHFADVARASADAERLGKICDKLGEIRRQMAELAWAESSDMNTKNLDIVNEQLMMFEGEFEAVVRVQKNATTKA